MKRKSAWLSFAACALISAHSAKAADEKAVTPVPADSKLVSTHVDYSNVQVITFSSNSEIGFFDRNSGTLYIYDALLQKCVSIKKLKTLGQPLETIKP